MLRDYTGGSSVKGRRMRFGFVAACVDVYVAACVDVYVDVYVDVCVDACVDVYVDACVDVCVDAGGDDDYNQSVMLGDYT
jgi:hypothetical protein